MPGMTHQPSDSMLRRRSFLSKLGISLTWITGAAGANASAAQLQSRSTAAWTAERHAQDDWFDQVPGKHRFLLDTTTAEGFGNALAFLNNYYSASESAYSLKAGDLAIVLVARHLSTSFAYGDAMWSKYGAPLSQRSRFVDPKTKQPPTRNLFNATDYGEQLTNRGWTLDSLLKRGLRLAVCQMSTRGYAGAVATATSAKPEAIYDELVANLVSVNARMVPAGIVAVNRAQERGYSLATVG